MYSMTARCTSNEKRRRVPKSEKSRCSAFERAIFSFRRVITPLMSAAWVLLRSAETVVSTAIS